MSEQNQLVAESDARSFLRGLPWVCLIPVCAFFSWLIWKQILVPWMGESAGGFASIGISTMGAYAICIIALANNWPLKAIENKWGRGIAMIALAKFAAFSLFAVLFSCGVNLEAWSFPIIANTWLVLAATSFVGADLHLSDIPPVRRMFLNLLISFGFTLLLMRTIVIFPASWFPFLQVTIITGGLAYMFRKTKQPVFSILVWAYLMAAMFIFLAAASWLGYYNLDGPVPQFWTWNIGAGTPEFNLFFALTCGMNFAVLACTQCWPFSRIRQPLGTFAAMAAMLIWCFILTCCLIALFRLIGQADQNLWNPQIMAWHTVFWGFAWVYCFGIGQTPYRWIGQKTPGTWDDVD